MTLPLPSARPLQFRRDVRVLAGIPSLLLSVLWIASLSLAPCASAQEPAAPQAATQSQQSGQPQQSGQSQQAQQPAELPQAKVRPEDDRLFGVLPNYLSVEDEAHVPPLSAGGKFKLVAKDAFDPTIFPFIGCLALLGQAENSEPSYGQGAAGYARRYGTSFADATIGTFMTGAVFPSLLKQDPRYYQLTQGGFRHRTVYSVSRIFISRSDSGHHEFNASEIFGNLAAAGIANSYHPAQDRGIANTLSVWGTDTGWDTVSNVSQEFWPDIHRWLKRKFAHPNPSAGSPSS